MKNVFIIGGTTYDHIISLDEFLQPVAQTIHQVNSLLEGTGSTGAGKALALNRFNIPVTLYSVLGDDHFGDHIIKHMSSEGVNFIFDIDPKGTERHFNIMNAEGERLSVFITQSSEHPKMDVGRIREAIEASDSIVLNIISYCKDIIPIVEEYNKPVWTDLHDYEDNNLYHEPFIDSADYIFLSSDNLSDYRKTMQTLMRRGKELVVCTHGKKGSTTLTKSGEWIDVPVLEDVKIVDTNGAGDNYFSGFLFAYMKGMSIADCMKYGTLCGATCISSEQLISKKLSADLIEKAFAANYGK